MGRVAHKPKILIIEDNTLNHDLYRTVFSQAGFDVEIREGADEFFPETVHTIAPDIVSMDLMIKEGEENAPRDGFEAMEALRKDFRTHEIPVMIMTNFFEEKKVKRAKELGAVDFIHLPGNDIQSIPKYFLSYLEDPKHYKPSHAAFRKH